MSKKRPLTVRDDVFEEIDTFISWMGSGFSRATQKIRKIADDLRIPAKKIEPFVRDMFSVITNYKKVFLENKSMIYSEDSNSTELENEESVLQMILRIKELHSYATEIQKLKSEITGGTSFRGESKLFLINLLTLQNSPIIQEYDSVHDAVEDLFEKMIDGLSILKKGLKKKLFDAEEKDSQEKRVRSDVGIGSTVKDEEKCSDVEEEAIEARRLSEETLSLAAPSYEEEYEEEDDNSVMNEYSDVVLIAEIPEEKQYEAFSKAIIENNIPEIRKLIVEGYYNINARGLNGRTALHKATSMERAEIVKFLLEETNADRNARDKYDDTPLYLAISCHKLKCLFELLNNEKERLIWDVGKGSNKPIVAAVKYKACYEKLKSYAETHPFPPDQIIDEDIKVAMESAYGLYHISLPEITDFLGAMGYDASAVTLETVL